MGFEGVGRLHMPDRLLSRVKVLLVYPLFMSHSNDTGFDYLLKGVNTPTIGLPKDYFDDLPLPRSGT